MALTTSSAPPKPIGNITNGNTTYHKKSTGGKYDKMAR
jgi:hypothetical protein